MAQVHLGKYEAAECNLPPFCLVCGAPATSYKLGTMAHTPGWCNVLLLLTFWPYIFVSSLLRKKMPVWAPLCDLHRRFWVSSRAGALARLAFSIALVPLLGIVWLYLRLQVTGSGTASALLMASWFIGILWLAARLIFLAARPLRAVEMNEEYVMLTNVSATFARALAKERGRTEGSAVPKPHEPARAATA